MKLSANKCWLKFILSHDVASVEIVRDRKNAIKFVTKKLIRNENDDLKI